MGQSELNITLSNICDTHNFAKRPICYNIALVSNCSGPICALGENTDFIVIVKFKESENHVFPSKQKVTQ